MSQNLLSYVLTRKVYFRCCIYIQVALDDVLSKNKKVQLFIDETKLYNVGSHLFHPVIIKMVGDSSRRFVLQDFLSENEVHHIVKQYIGVDVLWDLKGCQAKQATDGLAGFLGDHVRATLQVAVEGELKNIYLFIKAIPACNKPKADYIDKHSYFKREKLMFQILEAVRDDNDPYPWCPKAYLYTDSLIVMPDLAVEGYAARHYLEILDLQHVLVGVATIARFHAAFTNYETTKGKAAKRPYNTYQECGTILNESTFCDSPFLRACAKLTACFLRAYSSKSYRSLPDLESSLREKYLAACDTVAEGKGTLNVLIHKDLWINNVMFKYDNDVPINAIMVDFQLIRYAPPAFDLMTFMYLTTSRSFRETHEKEICDHYFSVFCDNLDGDSKQRVEDLGYDKKSFLYWCEESRMFAVLEPAAIHPFILMDPKTAQKTFDDPETYDKYIMEDRSEPVLDYANKCNVYKERILEISEEFVERYVLKQL